FLFSSAGNIVFNSGAGESNCAASQNYCYPPSNQPRPNAVTKAGSDAFGYDENGNMRVRGLSTLEYDVDNLPVSITDGRRTLTFSYSVSGARNSKHDSESGVTIHYIGVDYEENLDTGIVTKYFSIGSRLVAKRVGRETFW